MRRRWTCPASCSPGVLHTQARHAEAEKLARDAIQSRKERLGADHPSLSSPLNTLGMILVDRNRLEEAERHYRKALELWEHAFGRPDEGNPANLAGVRLTLGFEKEAEEIYARAVESCRARLGRHHR